MATGKSDLSSTWRLSLWDTCHPHPITGPSLFHRSVHIILHITWPAKVLWRISFGTQPSSDSSLGHAPSWKIQSWVSLFSTICVCGIHSVSITCSHGSYVPIRGKELLLMLYLTSSVRIRQTGDWNQAHLSEAWDRLQFLVESTVGGKFRTGIV